MWVMGKRAIFFFLWIAGPLCALSILTACSSLPPHSPSIPSHSAQRSQQVSQLLWTPSESRAISLKAITLNDPSHPTVRLILEKEGKLLLQLEASPNSVSARGPLGNWQGSPNNAPQSLKIWVAFALCQKNILMKGFLWQEDSRYFSLRSIDGKESLHVLRKFFKT